MSAVDFQHQFETSGDTQRHLNLILRMISFTHPTRAGVKATQVVNKYANVRRCSSALIIV